MSFARNDSSSGNMPASLTALSVISTYIRAAKTLFPGIVDEKELQLAQHLLNTAIFSQRDCAPRAISHTINTLPYPMQSIFFKNIINPAYEKWIFTRKHMIRQKIEKFVNEENIQQILLLGGGYDPLGFIVSCQYPHLKVFELDRGHTYQAKMRALTTLPAHFDLPVSLQEDGNLCCFNRNLYCIDCDLAENRVSEVLKNYDFNEKKKTLVIAEGLTMYLREDDIRALLADLKNNVMNESSSLLIGFLSLEKNSATLNKILHASNETYQFSLFPSDVPEFVNCLGYEVASKTNRAEGNNSAVNPAPNREYYYLLSPSENPKYIPIENVDDMDIDLKRYEKTPSFSCAIL